MTALEGSESGRLDLDAIETIKDLLAAESVAGKETYSQQISLRVSSVLLVGGLIATVASLNTGKELVVTHGMNPMELLNIATLTAWLSLVAVLLFYSRSRVNPSVRETNLVASTPIDVQ